jgi:hypothetical protein
MEEPASPIGMKMPDDLKKKRRDEKKRHVLATLERLTYLDDQARDECDRMIMEASD